jgi:hypothetical protein
VEERVQDEPRRIDPDVVAGFAVGVGLVFVATLGVYWHFWRPEATLWTWGLGSFAIGAALGGLYAAARRIRL